LRLRLNIVCCMSNLPSGLSKIAESHHSAKPKQARHLFLRLTCTFLGAANGTRTRNNQLGSRSPRVIVNDFNCDFMRKFHRAEKHLRTVTDNSVRNFYTIWTMREQGTRHQDDHISGRSLPRSHAPQALQ